MWNRTLGGVALARHRVFGRPYVVLVSPILDETELYSTYLNAAGFLVKAFDRSAVALRSIRRHPPDAVITRIRQATGEPDGLALTARLREQPELARTPVPDVRQRRLAKRGRSRATTRRAIDDWRYVADFA